jgi:hypothetical protein
VVQAGRKPKADEIKLIETMDAIAVPDTVWKMLYAKVMLTLLKHGCNIATVCQSR